MSLSEFDLIKDIFRPLTLDSSYSLGLRDDAALIDIDSGFSTVVTSDSMSEGTHFTNLNDPQDIGYKLLCSNLSDIAAMGAYPLFYLLNTALPSRLDKNWVINFAEGLKKGQDDYNVCLIGGDTIQAETLVLSMTLIGRVVSGQELRRSGACPGDNIYVSGTIGDAGIGLNIFLEDNHELDSVSKDFLLKRFLRPSPRVSLGSSIANLASSAIDISDGLLMDLGHICSESTVSAELSMDLIPISDAARKYINGDSIKNSARITSGEDYELLFTAPKEMTKNITNLSSQLEIPITLIGKIAEGSGIKVFGEQNSEISFDFDGFEHFKNV